MRRGYHTCAADRRHNAGSARSAARAHVPNAIARFGQTAFVFEDEGRGAVRKVLAAAKRHEMEVGPDGVVATAAQG